MSLESETESIVWPTLYQSAALRRSSFSTSVAGAMVVYSVSAFVLQDDRVDGRVLWYGKTRAVVLVGEGGASSPFEFRASPSRAFLPFSSHSTSLLPDHRIYILIYSRYYRTSCLHRFQ